MARDRQALGNEAKALVGRIHAVPLLRALDRPRVEAALAAHLDGLALSPRPVLWIPAPPEETEPRAHARAGFLAAWQALGVQQPGETALRSPTDEALHGSRAAPGALRDAEYAEKSAGRAARRTAERAADAVAAELGLTLKKLDDVGWASSAVRDAAHAVGLQELAGIGIGMSALQRTASDVESELDVASAARAASRAACWLARAEALESAGSQTSAVSRLAAAYLPLVDALEGGLWLFWVTEDEVLAVAAPASLSASARIERPRDLVWQAFADIAAWRDWYHGFDAPLEEVEPDWSEGAQVRWAIGPPSTITACIPGRTVTMAGGVNGPGARIWSFDDAADGATTATYETYQYCTPVPEGMLAHFKEYVEGRL